MSRKLLVLMAILPCVICKAEDRTIFLVDLREEPINKLLKIVINKEKNVNDSKEYCQLDTIKEKLIDWSVQVEENPLFFENPFNSFLYIKLLRTDLKLKSPHESDSNFLEGGLLFLKSVISVIPFINLISDTYIHNLPSKQDLVKSAQLVGDLMETFNISILDEADSESHELLISSLSRFTSADCLALGKALVDKKRADLASQWALLAEQKMLKEKCVYNAEDALDKLNDDITYVYEDAEVIPMYNRLCLSKTTQIDMNSFRNGSLICETFLNQDIFRPKVKMELLSPEPKIQLFHEFLSLEEVEELLIISRDYNLEQAGETNLETGATEYGFDRVCDNVFLNEDKEPYAAEVKQKIGYVTGLNMENAEELEIIRYRPGGVFPPHTDYFEDEALAQSPFGNRIVIAMIFLSRVELGGNFVMPYLNISVTPNIGDLVIFYNVDKNGNNDLRTVHAGCKLFIGNKVLAVNGMHHVDQNHMQCAKEDKQETSKSHPTNQKRNMESKEINEQKNDESQGIIKQKNVESQGIIEQKNVESQGINKQKNVESQGIKEQKNDKSHGMKHQNSVETEEINHQKNNMECQKTKQLDQDQMQCQKNIRK